MGRRGRRQTQARFPDGRATGEAAPTSRSFLRRGAQFRAAVERDSPLDGRPAVESSLDCASFLVLVMEERNITEALAYDRDFEQAGFVALLRENQV